MVVSHYQEIATYYDLLMDGGYYDHSFLAKIVHSAIGQRTTLLELGVGTGLLLQELLKVNPDYDLVGIDFSRAMVDIAKKRLPDHVSLVECDVATMDLGRTFEVAISSGGVWVIIQSGDELLLGTHLFNQENDVRGLQSVASHLKPGGMLLLSVHPPHEDRDLELENGIVYSQAIGKHKGTSEHFSIEKHYCFKEGKHTLAEEVITLGFYSSSIFLDMMASAGFKPLGMLDNKKFFAFEKVIPE